MLTRATRIKLVVFAVLTVVVVGYTGIHYAKLGRFVGLRGYYVVKLDLANAGGLFQNADVDYRGVSIGRVGALSLTATGVQASLDISDSAPPIPAQLKASVADLSAVGEQYVDLRPQADQGPYLASGSVIPERDTQLPLPVTTVLESINQLATSVPLRALRQVTNDLGTAFGGQGGNLQQLVDGSYSLVKASSQNLPQQVGLINAARTVLRTQVSETQALDSFGASARQLAATLAASNADIRKLIVQGPRAATQVAGLLTDNNPGLAVMIANLLTTSELTATRGSALAELLSALPADIAAGSTVITSGGANFGIALTFFNPLPCTAGYGGTIYRNGLDTTPAPLNTSAQCDEPASQGDARGSAHAPSGGGVPTPAQPGLSQLLGLSP
jgi:phospholipid/cholesterol/gamma-HCH transport system substrate-binding protein